MSVQFHGGCLALGLSFAVSVLCADEPSASSSLWYEKPAKRWMQNALPIGNGSFGGMVFGSVEEEKIQLNVDSLWTGDSKHLGAYQNLGQVCVSFENAGKATDYRRVLDLKTAIHRVDYESKAGMHRREAFASASDKVIVVKFEGDRMSGRIRMEDDLSQNKKEKNKKSRKDSKITADKDSILMAGTLVNDLRYAARIKAKAKGGKLFVQGNQLVFQNVGQLVIFIAADTDYVMDVGRNWKGQNPNPVVKQRVETAARTGVPRLRKSHIKEYQRYYDRFSFDIGTTESSKAQKPTDERLKLFQQDMDADPDFNELIVNYARYLMISCSRPGCLPANLQGLWCENNSPPWCSDYHSNINVQMNYWFALPMNLADCHQAFCDYIMAMREPRLLATSKELRHPSGKQAKRGWIIKTGNNIFGGAAGWNFPGTAWYAQHLYEQYAFTQDRDVLKKQAYVVLKETCQFWEDRLKERPDGTLVAPRGWSPEHGPTEDGVTYDQMIIHDLFTNYIEAATDLGVDADYVQKVKAMRSQLLAPKIGKWGQLQEWETDRDDPKNHHRHVSHLFGVHPGRQIIPGRDEKLTRAAIVSLNARGDGGTGWSKAWKISFWARLRDGDRAYKLLSEHIAKNFYPNLFDFHPPFQIDGNFGHAAGVAECLLQSHQRSDVGGVESPWIIELLPALPSQWSEGIVQGLKARGNVTVDISWSKGKLKRARLMTSRDATIRVKSGKKMKVFKLKKGKARIVIPEAF